MTTTGYSKSAASRAMAGCVDLAGELADVTLEYVVCDATHTYPGASVSGRRCEDVIEISLMFSYIAREMSLDDTCDVGIRDIKTVGLGFDMTWHPSWMQTIKRCIDHLPDLTEQHREFMEMRRLPTMPWEVPWQ